MGATVVADHQIQEQVTQVIAEHKDLEAATDKIN